jgi:hypothetical protein
LKRILVSALLASAVLSGGAALPLSTKHSTEPMRFPAGSSSFEFPAQLPPGMTVRYLVGARKNQSLNVAVASSGGALSNRIGYPDGSALLDAISVDTPYRGQLW